ncbi:LuxR C-terminal-related transcriptional regulator [Streptomyces sp. NPDC053367]|uniref:helix-turn-helix transcriptional regulator n=1 Tax=Streptomyces sp. NPDC053367 TaxID=3365700 RepID=UPI0037D860D8
MTGRTTVTTTAPRIHGRGPHLRAVAASAQRGGALLVTGEPGIGRTTLLDHAARAFTAGPVLHLRAGPRRALGPYDGLRAWAGALGGVPHGPGEPEAQAGSLLPALRAAAGGRPLLLCLDDVHLWDAPSRTALGHAARRLPEAGPVVLLVSAAGHAPDGLAGLPALHLGPLPAPDAGALLDDVTGSAVDPASRDELLDAADGNPALLLALAARLSPAGPDGRQPLAHSLTDALTAVAGTFLDGLPPEAADLLLVTAAALRDAEAAGADAALVGAALACLGDDEAPLAARPEPVGELPAAAAGPLRLADGQLCFAGPVLRRAVYAQAAPARRRAAHRALARVLDRDGHRLRALLHRARATAGPAPALAAELTAAAADPRSPAPHRLRSLAHAGAAELAADESARAQCRTAAAEQALRAGLPRRALSLLGTVAQAPVPAAVRGRAELLRGSAQLLDGPTATARASLLTAAALLAADAPALAATATTCAADAAWAAGDLPACLESLSAAQSGPNAYRRGLRAVLEGRRGEGAEVLRAVAAGVASGGLRPHGRAAAAAGDGGRGRAGGRGLPDEVRGDAPGWAAGAGEGVLRRVTGPPSGEAAPGADGFRHGDGGRRPGRRTHPDPSPEGGPDAETLLRGAVAALVVGDMPVASRVAARAVAHGRADGDMGVVPRALEYLAYAELRSGRHAQARTYAEEGLREAERAGQRNTAAGHHAVLALAASIEGEPAAVAGHAEAALATARRHGLAQTATLAQWALARADLGRGRPLEAADRLGPLVRPGPRRGHFAVWMLAVPCFVEAAVLAGRPADARCAVEDLAAWAAFGADPQAPAQLLRCRALLAPPEHADALYARALEAHEQTVGDFERARTELLYGKWLRRRRRLREARDRLGAALVGFESSGALVWAEQARGELRAHGTAPGPARADGLAGLTPQQCRIARYVADGATNREVARILSVSTRTVDYHLRNVFAALGVRSRVELARLVEQAEQPRARP